MRTLYCSTCSRSFDSDRDGVEGKFNGQQVAFCGDCLACVMVMAEGLAEDAAEEDLPRVLN